MCTYEEYGFNKSVSNMLNLSHQRQTFASAWPSSCARSCLPPG